MSRIKFGTVGVEEEEDTEDSPTLGTSGASFSVFDGKFVDPSVEAEKRLSEVFHTEAPFLNEMRNFGNLESEDSSQEDGLPTSSGSPSSSLLLFPSLLLSSQSLGLLLTAAPRFQEGDGPPRVCEGDKTRTRL